MRTLRAAALITAKDVLSLRRAPLLVILLAAYPLFISGLVGLVANYANSRPKIAIVDLDQLPAVTEIGGHTYHIKRTIERVGENVRVEWMAPGEAARALRTGKVVGVVTVPHGFLAEIKGMTRAPTLTLELSRGGIAPRVSQQMQALVFALNRSLQDAYLEGTLRYIALIRHGGTTSFFGSDLKVLGLDGAQRLLDELPPGRRRTELQRFIATADVALRESRDSLHAVAQPIQLDIATKKGRSWLLSAQVQANAIALTLSLLALVLAATATASERDENVAGLLGRGLAPPRVLLIAKIALATVIALAIGLTITVVFGAIVEIGNITGGQPWTRIPLLAAGIALSSVALGAIGTLIGALAREGRIASLAALLVALPIVLVGLVPPEITPFAGAISDLFPFGHSVRLFGAALYDLDPWPTIGPEALWLGFLGLFWSLVARVSLPRLLAN